MSSSSGYQPGAGLIVAVVVAAILVVVLLACIIALVVVLRVKKSSKKRSNYMVPLGERPLVLENVLYNGGPKGKHMVPLGERLVLDNVLYDGVAQVTSSSNGAVDITVHNGECCALTRGDV